MQKYTIEIKWALIFALMTLLWSTGEKLLGFHDQYIDKHMIATNFIFFPAVTIYVLAFLEKRKKDLEGKMTYKQGFIFGFIVSVIVALLSPLSQTIISLVVTPDYFANMIKYSVENGLMSQADAEANFNLPSYLVQASVGSLVIGTVTSAVVAIFTRKK